VFDPDGKLIRTFGRMGQGPGEFRQPFYVSVCPATREVLVTDFMFGMHLFDMDGRFIRKIGTERPFMARLDSRGRVVYLHSTVDDKGNAEFETRRAGLNAESSRQIAVEVRRALDLSAPIPYWDLGAHDRIAYGCPTDYEIRIYDGDNKLVRKVRREYDRVETTKEQKSDLDKSASLIGAPVDDVAGILADHGGRLLELDDDLDLLLEGQLRQLATPFAFFPEDDLRGFILHGTASRTS